MSEPISRLEAMFMRHEGVRLKPYLDQKKKLTIGVGRNLSDRGLSYDESLFLMRNDLAEARRAAAKFSWFNDLSEARKDALTDMIANMGETHFRSFKDMIHCLELSDFKHAAEEMLDSEWADEQVGNRAVELARMMATGEYGE